MKLNEIRDNEGSRRAPRRVGRGLGSGLGKTSGKGQKGQKSRSGVSLLGFEGGQMPLFRRLPKRGFKNPFAKDVATVNLGQLQAAIDAGKVDAAKPINAEALQAAGVARKSRDGVKLLAKGELKAKVDLEIAAASGAALAAVEKAGGKVSLPAPSEKPEGKGKRRHKIQAERAVMLEKARAGEISESTAGDDAKADA